MKVTLGYLESILGSFGGYFGYVRARFRKTFIFPWILMTFSNYGTKLGSLWGHIGGTLGLLWVSDCGFGSLFGHFDVTLGSVWALEGAW